MTDISNDYIKKLNDIEIFSKQGNIGISKENPVYKMDVNGPIYSDGLYIQNASITKGINDELVLMNKGSDNSLSIDKTSSYLITDKLGINNQTPQQTLDVYGNIKMSGSLYGMDNREIIGQNADIVLNPSNDFGKVVMNAPTTFKSTTNGGGILIGDSNLDPKSGSLMVEDSILDSDGNNFVKMNDINNFDINTTGSKSTNFFGAVNFYDNRYGVRIGNVTEEPDKGELYVQNSINIGKKITIKDSENKMIDMSGNNNGNIFLGESSYIGNLNSFGDKKQSMVIGHNLMAGENNVRVANSEVDGYRGIVMDRNSGINFYVKKDDVESGNVPELPSLSILNSGQLIYSLPILEIIDINIQDVTNPIHKYIRKQLGTKKIGSMMDFSTSSLIRENIIFNSIKITDSTVRTFKIKKDTNSVEDVFETSI